MDSWMADWLWLVMVLIWRVIEWMSSAWVLGYFQPEDSKLRPAVTVATAARITAKSSLWKTCSRNSCHSHSALRRNGQMIASAFSSVIFKSKCLTLTLRREYTVNVQIRVAQNTDLLIQTLKGKVHSKMNIC